MTDNFKMCLELTEELEKHKKRINQYKQKLKAKEQECEAYKMEADEGKEINAELKAENDELKKKVYKYEQAEKYPAAFLWQEGLL